MKKIALILAGGKGNRFWPKSSLEMPKQFINIIGDSTLFQETVKRAALITAEEDIYIVSSSSCVSFIKNQAPQIPQENIILEPCGRDTAPALGYSLVWLQEKYSEAALFILPSDHYVAEMDKWKETLIKACDLAESKSPVVIGISPNRPETGYGYIKKGNKCFEKNQVYWKVTEFIEKPDFNKALKFLEAQDYLWNSGMFIWKLSDLIKQYKKNLPCTFEQISEIYTIMKNNNWNYWLKEDVVEVKEEYKAINPISIDYGIMEHLHNIYLLPGIFLWDDVGGWQALERLHPKDSNNNINLGNAALIKSDNCIVDCYDGTALIAGIKDTVVAHQDSKLLVCHKDYLPQLKELLKEAIFFKREESEEHEGIKKVEKPWGQEIWWAVTNKYAAKILEIEKGSSTSFHYHQKKLETFYITKGRGTIKLQERTEELYPGKVIEIYPGEPHRLNALSNLQIIEVSTPELDDVVRISDYYGRSD